MRTRRRAFTLVELMAVIGIIVLLTGILVPSVMRATTAARRTRQAMDLQSIAAALTAYHNDFRAYPPVDYDGEGPYMLSKALIGPEPTFLPPVAPGRPDRGDGQDGPGFRVRHSIGNVPQGKVWGPYLNPDHFLAAQPPNFEILDLRGRPILYFPTFRPALRGAVKPDRYLGTWAHNPPSGAPRPYLNAADCWSGTETNRQYMEASKMDAFFSINRSANDFTGNAAGMPRPPPGESDYVLWSSGPDELFGPIDPAHPEKCDDVVYPPLP